MANWCSQYNCWCSDVEEIIEDLSEINCDCNCHSCPDCEEIKPSH